MNNNKKILGVILARGGSKQIPKKNIALLNNIPLIAYTIVEGKKSKYISDLVVSSDDDEIKVEDNAKPDFTVNNSFGFLVFVPIKLCVSSFKLELLEARCITRCTFKGILLLFKSL